MTYKPGADLWLLLVAALALIGYVLLIALGHGADGRLLDLVGAALIGGAGIATPRGVTRALTALSETAAAVTELAPAPAYTPAPTEPPAAPPIAAPPVEAAPVEAPPPAPVAPPAYPPFADQP